ncbi:hypothetical protein LTR94_023811 [Friedmanniomyces endolithicus]|nr:hypothetical protein LTR94_023811 [Friedmanniomyces endolithicus]
MDYGRYITHGSQVTVILTTRLSDARKWASPDPQDSQSKLFLQLTGLDPESAIDLEASETQRNQETIREASRIATALDHHPLAVTVASSLIEARFTRLKASTISGDELRYLGTHALAGAYRANGQIAEAVEMLEQVVQVQESLAEDHPDGLASQHALADAHQANGQIAQAVELLEHVVRVEERLAEDHPDRLASHHGLAYAY